MYRPVYSPHQTRRTEPGVPRHAVQRLVAERDGLAQDRQTLIEEVKRLRHELATAAQANVPYAEPEPVEEEVVDTDASRVREQELLGDIERLQRTSAARTERAVHSERGRLLSVVADAYDDVARAIAQSPEAVAGSGAAMLSAYDDRLRSVGVRRIGAVGDRFEPTRFEAVGVDETRPHNQVVSVVSSGLEGLDGQLLRPAKVVVGTQ